MGDRASRGLCLRVWESRKADARSSEHPRGCCSPLSGTNSPGLDDPSLIRIGLAKFTRIVLPKSSDSFCRGRKAEQNPPKGKKPLCPPKSLQRSGENRDRFLRVAHATQSLAPCSWEDGRATHLRRRVGTGSVPCCQ